MAELISESIEPLGEYDSSRMAIGEPGLPAGFRWRGDDFLILKVLGIWKKSRREGGVGELYLRRHCWRLRMEDGSTWEIYFTRRASRGASWRGRRKRWFLYTLER